MPLLVVTVFSVSLFMVVMHTATLAVLDPVVISGTTGACLSQEMRDAIMQNITASVQATLEANPSNYNTLFNCGPGTWDCVAYLNMSDLSQQCPTAWREDNSTGIRFCRRPHPYNHGCLGTFYNTGSQYSKVCGRAIGYQIGVTEAFGYSRTNQTTDYTPGVSVTHGAPRNHIWTFSAGLTENDTYYPELNCPCNDPNNTHNKYPPSFAGDNYYCESGNPYSNYSYSKIYTDDPLWDGQQCEGQCCNGGKSPPWFSVELLNLTTDDIEVRICNYEDDGIGLKLLELYIQ